MKNTPVILIAAINALGFIGNEEGDLICKCSRDLQRFKEHSNNGVLIMGRKTYESLPKALPGRSVVVVTSKRELNHPEGAQKNRVLSVSNIGNALEAAHRLAELHERDKIVIAGGTSIFAHFLLDAEEIYLTRFSDDTYGGARFPTEALDAMIASDRLARSSEYSFYDGEMRVTFEKYELTPCIEWIRGDLVKLRNGARFRTSRLQSYIRTEDSVMLACEGFGFHVTEQEMNLDRLLVELDELMCKVDSFEATLESTQIPDINPDRLYAVGEQS